MKTILLSVSIAITVVVRGDDILRPWSYVWPRQPALTNVFLHGVNFNDTPLDAVISNINHRCQTELAAEHIPGVVLDLTPTQYRIVPDTEDVREAANELIAGRKKAQRGLRDSETTLPRFTCRASAISVGDLFGILVRDIEFGWQIYATKTNLIIRFGVPLVECRAYQVDREFMRDLRRGLKEPINPTALFVEGKGQETNDMKWLEGPHILLHISTPDDHRGLDEMAAEGRNLRPLQKMRDAQQRPAPDR